jgi:hypothetical protein
VGFCYPIATTVVVLGTANHFIVDAIAGAAVLAIATSAQLVSSAGQTRRRTVCATYADGSES